LVVVRLVATTLLLAVAAGGACSSAEPDRVVIDAGTIPPEVTATSAPTNGDDDGGGEATTTTTALGPPTLDASSAVTTAGIGDVAFGMSLAEAQRAAGSLVVPIDDDHDPDGCYVATLDQGPSGLRLTFSVGVFERLDVVEGAVSTLSGAGIGDTTAQLDDLFGDSLEGGTDIDGNQVLTFVPTDESDEGTLIIFTIADDRVTELRSGRRPIVETGCR